MARSFITGASGFIGYHTARKLVARGDEVVCLVRRSSNTKLLQSLGVTLVYGDVTDPSGLGEAIQGCDRVFHVAGRTVSLNRQGFYDVNEQGTRNILEACVAQSKQPTVVVVSSLSAAGPAASGDKPLDESVVPAPVSYYGRSKLAGEQVAVEFADRLPITIVRPAIVLGENDYQGLIMFSSISKTRLHVVPGLGRLHYSVIHAADLVNLMLLAAERGTRLQPIESQTANISTTSSGTTNDCQASSGYYHAVAENLTYSELGRQIGYALGIRTRIIPTPPRSVWFIGAWNQITMQIIRRTMYLCFDKAREVSAGHWIATSDKAKAELGFQPELPLIDRLEQTARWYRCEGLIPQKRHPRQRHADSLSHSK